MIFSSRKKHKQTKQHALQGRSLSRRLKTTSDPAFKVCYRWVLSVEMKSAKSNCSVILDLAFTRAYKAIFEAIKNREISSNLALLSIFLSLKCRLFAIYNDRRGSNYCCGGSVITHPLCTIPTEVYQKTT